MSRPFPADPAMRLATEAVTTDCGTEPHAPVP
jgi:hypothetical protein